VNEVVHAVIAGRADIGWERIPWVAGTFPQWDYALPFFWDSIFEYEAFLNDPAWSRSSGRPTARRGW